MDIRKTAVKENLLVTPHHFLMTITLCALLFGGIAYLRLGVAEGDRGWKALIWMGAMAALLALEILMLKWQPYRNSFMTRPFEKQKNSQG